VNPSRVILIVLVALPEIVKISVGVVAVTRPVITAEYVAFCPSIIATV
jgi:hypothetical protein